MTLRAYCLSLTLPALIGVVCLSGTAVAQADDQTGRKLTGVVELFTSQGCSSCPPADAELVRLDETGKVLTLSYHVDYWNYLGWTDTMSSRANTDRQYGYARTLRRNNVYTPQAVINGQDHANGADGDAITSILSRLSTSGSGLTVDVRADMDSDGMRITVGEGQGKADIVVVYFDESTTVKINSGENAGKTVTYRHSVQDVGTVGMWDGEQVTLKLPVSVMSAHPGRGCAILLQEVGKDGAPGRILGAAVIDPDEAA